MTLYRDHYLVGAGLLPIKRAMRVAAKATILALRRAVPESSIAQGSSAPAIDDEFVSVTPPRLGLSPMTKMRIGMLIIVIVAAVVQSKS